jgi:hypothetical protein
MAQSGILHPVMPGLIGYPTMYLHQQQVFEAVKGGKHVLVATGTGSGKTESFLYPIIDDLLRKRDQGILGAGGVLVYPMNALANDNWTARTCWAAPGITFGRWVGTTPRKKMCRRAIRRIIPAGVLEARASGGKKPRPKTGPCALLPRGCWRTTSGVSPDSPDELPSVGVLTSAANVPCLRCALRYLVFDDPYSRGHRQPGRLLGAAARAARREVVGRDHLHWHVGDPLDPQRTRTTTRLPGVCPVLWRRSQQRLSWRVYVNREWPKQRYRPLLLMATAWPWEGWPP